MQQQKINNKRKSCYHHRDWLLLDQHSIASAFRAKCKYIYAFLFQSLVGSEWFIWNEFCSVQIKRFITLKKKIVVSKKGKEKSNRSFVSKPHCDCILQKITQISFDNLTFFLFVSSKVVFRVDNLYFIESVLKARCVQSFTLRLNNNGRIFNEQ